MKILHISDLHYPDTEDNPKLLVEKIINHYKKHKTKPCVVLSGDILESSISKSAFHEARQILQPLKDSGFPLMICPGNHDLKAFGIGPVVTGRIRFNNYFKGLLPEKNNYYGPEDNELHDFPIVHKFRNHFFIGLDSMAAESGPGTTGELGKEQLDELVEILDEIRSKERNPIIIVYLHHHPLKFTYRPRLLRLKDKKRLLEIIRGVNVLLFGHLHFIERFPKDEKRYDIDVIHLTGGSAYGRHVDWTEIDTRGFSVKVVTYKK